MIISIVVSLYTTRVVLQVLGVTDFGIYNVIGGAVAMFAFLTTTMANASTRFFSFEIGRGDIESQTKTFRVMVTIYLLLIVLIVLIGETAGLWFVTDKLNIPADRRNTALIVYQFTLLTLILNVIRIPFNAAIISHEKMAFYAYLSIAESFLKLGIVYLLVVAPWDKLAFYAILIAIVTLIVTILYYIYTRIHFSECKLGFDFSADKFKDILSFSGWNLASNFGDVMMDQGLNILLNIFFNPVVNAARGIAYSVKAVMTNFVGNFQAASTPQITKHYASSEMDQLHFLVLQTSKLSYYLILVMVIPACFCIKTLLGLWLTEIPDYTVSFTYLLFIEILILGMGGTLNIAIQATGKIKRFVITLSVIKIACFILVYLGFKLCGFPPEYAFWICVLNSFCCMATKFIYYSRIINAKFMAIINTVIFLEIKVTIIALIPIAGLAWLIYNPEDNTNIVIMTLSALIIVMTVVFYTGLNHYEREKIIHAIRQRLSK